MAYKHILIAVDLSPESKVLVEKAVSMARPYNAKVSLIHVDVNYSDLYTGLIDVNLGDMQKRISEETHHALSELSTNAGYPISETLSGSGDLGQVLVEKAVSMARPYNAKVSLIHVDVNYSDLYTGLIDVNLGDMQKRISEETHHALSELSTNAGYPISETLSGSGDLGQVLVDAIKKYDVDLVLCGHHQDFWSKLMSSARQLINTVHIDMLIVPLRDEEEE